ncbi:MAG: hypothetical protein NZ919_01915 [Candidatus Caldarchaeum sp.]|nr:hypothetical protein [Candidatus Caldarchaeum sp.]
MLGHLQKTGGKTVCKVCGAEPKPNETFHHVTGFGDVCRSCGLQQVVCDGCGSPVRRLTSTVLRGRTLCLPCYRAEREKGDKRIIKERSAESVEEALAASLAEAPEGYRLVGLRLRPSSTKIWMAEYEREDIYLSRCS